ncbi:hypothetical protein TSAR_002588, partial [Trichomalopsis sarcophagae]
QYIRIQPELARGSVVVGASQSTLSVRSTDKQSSPWSRADDRWPFVLVHEMLLDLFALAPRFRSSRDSW